jgi:Flp pilus assembly protein TadG
MSAMKASGRAHGVAMVELAISLLVLISIAFGMTELGRAIYQYNTLTKSARDAVRLLSMRDPSDDAAKNQAKCLAVYGNPGCTGAPLAPGLSVAMVSICDALACPADHAAQGSAPVINLVTVTIGGPNAPYVFASLISFVVPDIAFGPISATMKQVL